MYLWRRCRWNPRSPRVVEVKFQLHSSLLAAWTRPRAIALWRRACRLPGPDLRVTGGRPPPAQRWHGTRGRPAAAAPAAIIVAAARRRNSSLVAARAARRVGHAPGELVQVAVLR